LVASSPHQRASSRWVTKNSKETPMTIHRIIRVGSLVALLLIVPAGVFVL
jgi:hypothetical protein